MQNFFLLWVSYNGLILHAVQCPGPSYRIRVPHGKEIAALQL